MIDRMLVFPEPLLPINNTYTIIHAVMNKTTVSSTDLLLHVFLFLEAESRDFRAYLISQSCPAHKLIIHLLIINFYDIIINITSHTLFYKLAEAHMHETHMHV